jgi:FkbM family methyltransferase
LGEVTLYRRLGRSGNNSIAKPAEDFTALLGEPPSEAFTAKSLRIDDLLPQMDGRIDFIKLDVEGAEPLVIAGARETIRTNPQLRIAMEWCPGQANAASDTLSSGDHPRQIGRRIRRCGL